MGVWQCKKQNSAYASGSARRRDLVNAATKEKRQRSALLPGTVQLSHRFLLSLQLLQTHQRCDKTYPRSASFGSGLLSSAEKLCKLSGKPENGILEVASSQRRDPSENTSDLSESGWPLICLRSQKCECTTAEAGEGDGMVGVVWHSCC